MPVAGNKVKVTFPEQVALNSPQYRAGVAFADFRHDHANREGAQRSGEEVWAVIELAGGREDLLLRRLGYGVGHRGKRLLTRETVVGEKPRRSANSFRLIGLVSLERSEDPGRPFLLGDTVRSLSPSSTRVVRGRLGAIEYPTARGVRVYRNGLLPQHSHLCKAGGHTW